MEFLRQYSSLFYHHFNIKMSATEDVSLDAWPGAIIRNNLLFAADKIHIHNTSRSLREQIERFTLDEVHPLYKELRDGFPKGYVLTDFSHTDTPVIIKKDEIFSFSLLLVGNFNDYRFYFFEAIREMCERGIGKPITPFRLSDISENSLSPVALSDFMQRVASDDMSEVTVRFQTPVILFRLKEKKNKQISYQDKNNRFPGLYQLTRSAFSRLQKLYALYVEPTLTSPSFFDETKTESYLEKAGQPLLKSAAIQHINLQNTQKKEMKNEMPLAGYVGEHKYTGHFSEYLPLLKFMEKLGVGNETVYGMGRYEVEEQYLTKQADEDQKIEVCNEVYTLDGFINRKENDLENINLPRMLKIPQIIVRFKIYITQKEIPLFVENISKKVFYNDDRFQKHVENSPQYLYPLIQFKRMNGKATIICIGEGVESIGGFFSTLNGSIKIDEKEIVLEIDSVKAEKILVQAWENNFTYTLYKYLPLSSENYTEYQKINEEKLRYDFIEKILRANIFFFAESMGIHFEREIICKIMELEEKETVKYKNHRFVSFDIKFKTNVSLPNYIGMGMGVGHGFGTVARVRSQKLEKQ